jgi:ribosomal protein S6E (S10)
MAFKINVAHKGRTFKVDSDNEGLIRMKIGEKINGNMVSSELDGYQLEITGTSDQAGFPGIKGQIGGQLRGMLLTKDDLGMNQTRPRGLRLKKTVRGEEISDKTAQINLKVLKEGTKKFDEVCPPKPAKEKPGKEAKADTPVSA